MLHFCSSLPFSSRACIPCAHLAPASFLSYSRASCLFFPLQESRVSAPAGEAYLASPSPLWGGLARFSAVHPGDAVTATQRGCALWLSLAGSPCSGPMTVSSPSCSFSVRQSSTKKWLGLFRLGVKMSVCSEGPLDTASSPIFFTLFLSLAFAAATGTSFWSPPFC